MFRAIGVALRFLPVLVLLVERIRRAQHRESDGGEQITPEEIAATVDEACQHVVEELQQIDERIA